MLSTTLRRKICLNEHESIVIPNHIHSNIWIINHVGADGVRPEDSEGGEGAAQEGARHAPQPALACITDRVGADGVRPEDGSEGGEGAALEDTRHAPQPGIV